MQYTGNEDLFVQEFKQMILYRQRYLSTVRKFALENLPLPQGLHDMSINNTEYAVIKGVSEKYFDVLNNTSVQVYASRNVARPRVDSKGNVMRDESGAVMLRKISIPEDSMLVSTDKNIKLPNYITDVTGMNQKYVVTDTRFLYATCINNKASDGTVHKQYFYAIPKEYLYKQNPCALVMSINPRRAQTFYSSKRILLQNGQYIYLSVMPIKKIYGKAEQRIIYKGLTCNMDRIIDIILQFWSQTAAVRYPNGYILTYAFPKGSTVATDINGTNWDLAIKDMSNAMNTLDSATYLSVESLSMAEEQESEENESECIM